MCTRTTVSWSWPVSLRRRWTVGRLLSYGLECTLNAVWYNVLLLLHYSIITSVLLQYYCFYLTITAVLLCNYFCVTVVLLLHHILIHHCYLFTVLILLHFTAVLLPNVSVLYTNVNIHLYLTWLIIVSPLRPVLQDKEKVRNFLFPLLDHSLVLFCVWV